jgi:hypothetical protein
MFERIKRSRYIFWFTTIPSLGLTGLFTVTFLYEYYVVGIKKDIEGYPFGAEGPVAGLEYYKSADLYANHALTLGSIATLLFALSLYFVIKRKTLGLISILTILIAFMTFNVVTAIYN